MMGVYGDDVVTHTSVFLGDKAEVSFRRHEVDRGYIRIARGGDATIHLTPETAQQMAKVVDSADFRSFVEGLPLAEVPAPLVTGSSVLCPECNDRFDPSGDDDELSALEGRYTEHYEAVHRGS